MSRLYYHKSRKPDWVYEVFSKGGHKYECLITPDAPGPECNSFQVTYRNVQHPELSTFVLIASADRHWIPVNSNLVDPWLAEVIGSIIINNF